MKKALHAFGMGLIVCLGIIIWMTIALLDLITAKKKNNREDAWKNI